jgi:Pectate lyase superfamily protein/Right handed beta helix region
MPSRRAFLVALAIGVAVSGRTLSSSRIDRDQSRTGDGRADDTIAIQRTIDAAAAAGGGTVYFPAGIYRLTSTLNHRSDVTLLGSGWRSVLHDSVGNITILSLADCTGSAVDSLRFTGSGTLGIAGRAAIHGTMGRSAGPVRCRIVRNFIEAVGTCGIALDNATLVLVEDNYISRPVEHGLYLSESTVEITVTRNRITQAGFGGASTVVGIKLAGPNCRRNTVNGNVIDAPLSEGVICDLYSSDNLIEANTIRNTPQRCIRIVASSDRNLIRDNVLAGAGAEAIRDMGGTQTVIQGNTVEGAARAGIRLDPASSHVTVSGNHLIDVNGAAWSIDVSGRDHEIVSNNITDQVQHGIVLRADSRRITVDANNNRASVVRLSDQR